MIDSRQPPFPRWLVGSYSVFIAVLVPVYWIYLGPQNFLWGCDIALLLTLLALWRKAALPASMALLVTLIPDIVWNVDFLLHLVFGRDVLGANATAYMFEQSMPVFVRALSLFHVFLAPLLVWVIYRIGYDPRALSRMLLLTWVVIPASYWVTDANKNVNWVHGVGPLPPEWMPAEVYVIGLMLAIPLLVLLPTHLVLQHWFYRQ